MRDDSNGTRAIAWSALVLFVGGLLFPFVLYVALTAFAKTDSDFASNLSIAFGGIAELLALALSIVGWRHTPGKVAGVGVAVLLAVAILCRRVHLQFGYSVRTANSAQRTRYAGAPERSQGAGAEEPVKMV